VALFAVNRFWVSKSSFIGEPCDLSSLLPVQQAISQADSFPDC
jgi:hypothetical protein